MSSTETPVTTAAQHRPATVPAHAAALVTDRPSGPAPDPRTPARARGMAVTAVVLGAVAAVVAVTVPGVLDATATALGAGGDLTRSWVAAVAGGAAAGPAGDEVNGRTTASAPAGADVPAVPAEGVRADLSALDCDVLGEEAVRRSGGSTGGPVLLGVTGSSALTDHRARAVVPDAGQSLVLSCAGTGTWDDGTRSPVITELTMDADGDLFVTYAGQ